jgi:hypothetical protein
MPLPTSGRRAAAGAAAPAPAPAPAPATPDYLQGLVSAVALPHQQLALEVQIDDASGSMQPVVAEKARYFTGVQEIATKTATPGTLDRVLLVRALIHAAPIHAPILPYTKAAPLEAPPHGSTALFETAAEVAALLTHLAERAHAEGRSIRHVNFRLVSDGRSTYEPDELVKQGWAPLVKVLQRMNASVTVIGPTQEMCDVPVLEELAKPFGQPVHMLDTADTATLYTWQVADLLTMTGKPTSREDPALRAAILKARAGARQ